MSEFLFTDVTLRDGNHTVHHQFTADLVAQVAASLDRAGVDIIEVGHGDGLGGSSRHVGWAAATDAEYLKSAVGAVKNSRIAALMLPGIATKADLQQAFDIGVSVMRVAAHCTEADVTEQHIELSRSLGMMTIGYLVNSSMTTPDVIAREATKMADYGAEAIYLADSVGEFLPQDVRAYVRAVRDVTDLPIGYHGHNSMGCAIGNTLAAVEEGATMVDGSLKGFGGGAGNTQSEALVATMSRAGTPLNADLIGMLDAADKTFAPLVDRTPVVDSESLLMGFAGVYGGYINPIRRESAQFDLDMRQVIQAVGARRIVAGQEDVIIEIARDMAASGSRV